MDKEDVGYAFTGLLFSHEKEGNPVTDHTWMDLKDVALSEECRKSGEGASNSTSDLASTLRWSTNTVLREELRGSDKDSQDGGFFSRFCPHHLAEQPGTIP